jgi:molybdenum cofactor synthesis domain-containing protein
MTIAILATGDELIHGDTLNTNSHNIAHTLSSDGLPLGLQLTCSDDEDEIISCMQFLAQKHNIIIVIGGLGPTTDDLTRFALGQFTNQPLVQHKEALDHIKSRLEAAKVVINQGNLQQCLFPKEARLLPNPNGTAVGCYYEWNKLIIILLPGPPRECLPMFQQFALPRVQKTQRSKNQLLKWRVFGVAESEIGQVLEEALAPFDCQTGYRLEVPYVEFKVRCMPDLAATIQSIVDPILEPHLIATTKQKASEALFELIVKNQEPITIVDEVTGGLFETLLLKPGAHELIKFNGLVKTKLFFHLTGLEEYWSNKGPSGSTQLIIDYSNQDQTGRETHTIPFRSPLVVHYAAEWLSYRLLHLINQLH